MIWWRHNSKLSKSLRNITVWPLWRHLWRHQFSKAGATKVLPQGYTKPHAAVGVERYKRFEEGKESLRRTKNVFLRCLSFIWCIITCCNIESISRDTLYSLFIDWPSIILVYFFPTEAMALVKIHLENRLISLIGVTRSAHVDFSLTWSTTRFYYLSIVGLYVTYYYVHMCVLHLSLFHIMFSWHHTCCYLSFHICFSWCLCHRCIRLLSINIKVSQVWTWVPFLQDLTLFLCLVT